VADWVFRSYNSSHGFAQHSRGTLDWAKLQLRRLLGRPNEAGRYAFPAPDVTWKRNSTGSPWATHSSWRSGQAGRDDADLGPRWTLPLGSCVRKRRFCGVLDRRGVDREVDLLGDEQVAGVKAALKVTPNRCGFVKLCSL
jgi:hypothetical protein